MLAAAPAGARPGGSAGKRLDGDNGVWHQLDVVCAELAVAVEGTRARSWCGVCEGFAGLICGVIKNNKPMFTGRLASSRHIIND